MEIKGSLEARPSSLRFLSRSLGEKSPIFLQENLAAWRKIQLGSRLDKSICPKLP